MPLGRDGGGWFPVSKAKVGVALLGVYVPLARLKIVRLVAAGYLKVRVSFVECGNVQTFRSFVAKCRTSIAISPTGKSTGTCIATAVFSLNSK